ncbi:SDR family NAD(P)-dependent oxidoreductase [Sulfitobacter aestuariivivens]|uniref:SDR family NAD(P)-dependent oxidoreductase n=1 Tax=Sulfitobacter aestuariivivens TaxID=2766981 RepID=A0A927HEB0_9RHOB|nr:SDR family NAD(P)-dependent oxidoreductase [Sulfitobacter aestuariivivens]MBD3663701.1 SDR family NAD(P)-dependent oxidoreductase [Sulfitobacter aestuariivivens]
MTILITGASRGIGAGLAAAYSARGQEVIGTGRSVAAPVQLDVTRPDSHAKMAAALDGRAIDLLICNAGVYLDKGHALEDGYGADLWAQTFAANVTGVFLTIQTLLPNLRAAPGAKIAIISSQMASSTHAPGGSYIYRASKAAVLNLGRNLASDLKTDAIAVGIYHPGWVQTDMGGKTADITVDDAVRGLVARFDHLSIATTGCFETWDGRAHAF